MKNVSRYLPLTLCLLLLLAACGGEAAEGDEDSDEPIRVGVLLPFSGVYASLGEHIQEGMELYFESVDWEANGREIELIASDYEDDPQTALREYRQLSDQEDIDILTGIVNSGVMYALRDEVDADEMPFLVAHAGGDELTTELQSDYVFRSSFSSWQIGNSMGQWAYDNVAEEAYLAYADYAFGQEVSNAFRESFEEAGGEIVGEVAPPLGTNDFASYLSSINSEDPEAVYAFFAGSDSIGFVEQYDEYGMKDEIPLIGSIWLNAEDVRPAQGESTEGVLGSTFWDYNLETEGNEEFVEDYEEAYDKRPTLESVEGYDAARVIHETMESSDTTDADDIVEAMSQVSFTSPRGPIEFDPNTNHIIQNMYIVETVLENGETENEVIEELGEFQAPGN